MSLQRLFLFLLACPAALGLLPQPARAVTVPANFAVDDAVPGVTFDSPTGIAFLPDGRMLVAEKRGRVWAVKHGVRHPTPLWNGESEVHNAGERGLLGIAVDPNYASNRYLYLLYEVEPDSNGLDDDDNAFGRLTRVQVSLADSNAVIPSSRTILMGVDWPHAPLSDYTSHAVGSVRFGRDGSMIVTVGDGAAGGPVDAGGRDPTAFGPGKTAPYEDIGAFRAQYIGSLCGKVLRINPANGHGYASNPYVDGNLTSPASRVWAYGLRNPYRVAFRPGTGSTDTSAADPGVLFIGDVGWTTQDEIDVLRTKGQNFGWPCFEGAGPNATYQSQHPAHHDCASIGTPSNPATASAPALTFDHNNPAASVPPGSTGHCVIGGVFYTGTRYPAAYQNAYFFGDYSENWVRYAIFDANQQLVQLASFGTAMDGPVDFTTEPASGDVYYVALSAGQVRRIRWTGPTGNHAPVAVIGASPTIGVAPLAVSFTSAGSGDPDGDPYVLSFSFGDGLGSLAANPTHTFAAYGTYPALLTLDDGRGGVTRDTAIIVVAATSTYPTTGVLDDFNRPNGALGGSWGDNLAGLAIGANALVSNGSAATAVWTGSVFGPDQEAFVTLTTLTGGTAEHALLLEVQGTSASSGHVRVRYDATLSGVRITSFAPATGTVSHATIPAAFQPGDRLGARAYSNGMVEVFRNGVSVGSASVASYPFASLGGRIGLALTGATSSRLDDFGGGAARLDGNTAPVVHIVSPAAGAFYTATDVIHLAAQATDAQEDSTNLAFHWEVTLHHHAHTHAWFSSDEPSDDFAAGAHDDGLEVWFDVAVEVEDSGGLKGAATTILRPEIDLRPTALGTQPAQPGVSAPALYGFTLVNLGRMNAPASRWRLIADGMLLAEGDTLVPGSDSVRVERTIAPVLAAGNHTLRVVVDTLGALVETNETNNATTRTLTVVGGTAGGPLPRLLALSPPLPNPSAGAVAFTLDLPRAGPVEFTVGDLLGRRVWEAPARALGAGRWTLVWPAREAPAGLYFARIKAAGTAWTRRIAILR